ncbi:Zinc finger DNA binding protein [Operophtera brumata]|uniref:Zinc finger DNA binding protein n=1 Tax=Operophtera brumata TaxID=104452 RepID=A0A0L7LL08_OPEBR|nr:Zinc finger DNA binding protein [Operophtera brumata]
MRDNVLGAYRRAKTLKSDQLHIAGTPARIYMNEHLTLKHIAHRRHTRQNLYERAPHTETQAIISSVPRSGEEQPFQYVWIRHSSILVRERDDAPAFVIRTESDLEKIKSLNNNS